VSRSTVKRHPERAAYDAEAVHAVLDAAPMGHLGFVVDGQPFVIPMFYGRVDDAIYLHGSVAARIMRGTVGLDVCLTATLVDGLVLARSAFHHSMNYRSVVVLGVATEITEREEKLAALARVVDHMMPGRSADARPPDAKELASTRVLAVPLERVSTKVRAGGPLDDEEDLGVPCWAGVVPVALTALPAVPDPLHAPLVPAPPAVAAYKRGPR
jgi:nitroimidazol reductase NimA-like FMN-containing flavoprotein (pyridoxamine 5'-phosphate oxidase superfamily)